MYKEVGPFDAKAIFSELLRGVSEGQRYTISGRGKRVADLVPAQARPQGDAQLAMDALRKLPKVKGAGGAELAAMIRERRE